jgi:hypothetical protein
LQDGPDIASERAAPLDMPRWNDEWDPPDPLKGRPGWGRHHYATFTVTALLLAIVAIVALHAYHQYRWVKAMEYQAWQRQMEARKEAVGKTTHKP